MQRLKRLSGLAIVAALLFAQQSCDNSYGIFSEVQKEIEQVGQDFFKKKAVSSIVKFGSSYYAATAALYSRPESGTTWSKLDIDAHSNYFLYGFAATTTALYVTTDLGVFSYNGSTWTQLTAPSDVTPGSGQSFYADAVFSANNEIFVVWRLYDESDSDDPKSYYRLYHLNGTAFGLVNNMHSSYFSGGQLADNETIRGVAYDGSNYWFAAEDHLYSGDETLSGTPSSYTLTGIWSISSGAREGSPLYIGTQSGTLYRDGTSDSISISGEGNPLSCVVEVPLSNTPTWKLLVGTDILDPDNDSEGYFEASSQLGTLGSMSFVSGTSGLVASSSSIYASSVDDMPVHCFLYDGDGNSGILFVGISSYTSSTVHYGLYSSSWDGSTWSGWQAE
jgi:hypothetical protein